MSRNSFESELKDALDTDGIMKRIKVLEKRLRDAKEDKSEKSIEKLREIAKELNEAFELLRCSVDPQSSCMKNILRNIVCSETYSKLKDAVGCFIEQIQMFTGIGIPSAIIASATYDPNAFTRDTCAITAKWGDTTVGQREQLAYLGAYSLAGLAFLSVMNLMIKTSERVIKVSEELILLDDENIDINDIPEFRHLKNLNEDVKKILRKMENEGECPICYRNYTSGDEEDEKKEVHKRWLIPCGHDLCSDCLKDLIERKMLKECFYCKQNVRGISTRKFKEHYHMRHTKKVVRKSKKTSRKSKKTSRKSKKVVRKSKKAVRKSKKAVRKSKKAVRKSNKTSRKSKNK